MRSKLTTVILFFVLSSMVHASGIKPLNVIEFESKNGLILVEAELEGKQGVFLLDTGCPFFLINGKAETTEAILTSYHQDMPSEETQVGSFDMGIIHKNEFSAYKVDLQFLEDLLQVKLMGLIGTQIFDDHSFMIDFKNNFIRISDYADYPMEVGLIDEKVIARNLEVFGKHDMPIVEIYADGVKMQFGIDTGASHSFINRRSLKKLDHKRKSKSSIHIDELRLDNFVLQDLEMKVENLDNLMEDDHVQLDGILSPDMLNLSKLCFDFRGNRIFLFLNKA